MVNVNSKLSNYCKVSSQRNNQIKLTHYDDTKSCAHESQIVRDKENLTLNYGGPSERQASGSDQTIKALRQGNH